MNARSFAVCAMLLGQGACQAMAPLDPDRATLRSIAGQYELVAVDGLALPCCSETDSTGAVVSVVGGSLTLGEAPPERYVATPAGWFPESCVHEVPNGAHVDTSGVVHLPDSSTYRLPECGEGTYRMTITQRYDDPTGTSKTVPVTSSGIYTWSESNPAMVTLLNSHMAGPITRSPRGIDVKVHRLRLGPDLGTRRDPQYEFFRVTH